MWALGIETAGERGGVALLAENGQGYELAFDAGRVHAEALGVATDSLLRAVGSAREDLGLVAVDVGPGSFTGIRIGIAFAAGLGQALDLPAVGVRHSEALGLPAMREWPGRVVVWIHDRGQHLYAAWVSGGRVGPDSAVTLDRALARLSGRSQVLVVGSGARRFREHLAPLAPNVLWCPGCVHAPPLEVARRGLEKWKAGEAVPAGALEPCYVHPPLSQGKES